MRLLSPSQASLFCLAACLLSAARPVREWPSGLPQEINGMKVEIIYKYPLPKTPAPVTEEPSDLHEIYPDLDEVLCEGRLSLFKGEEPFGCVTSAGRHTRKYENCGQFVMGTSKTIDPKNGEEKVQRYLIINYSMIGGPKLYCELDQHLHLNCGFSAPSQTSTLEITADRYLKPTGRKTAFWGLEPDKVQEMLSANVRNQVGRLDDYLTPQDSGAYTIRCDPP